MTPRTGPTARRTRPGAALRTAAGALVVVAAGSLAGCSEDPVETYCAVVEREQQALAAAAEEPAGLLAAYDSLERLGEAAPRDLRDEWDEVLLRVGALRDALDAAGVDYAEYDPQQPVEGVGEEEREAITAAAVALVEPTTLRAVRSVEQQALDVCGTTLGL